MESAEKHTAEKPQKMSEEPDSVITVVRSPWSTFVYDRKTNTLVAIPRPQEQQVLYAPGSEICFGN